MLTVKQAWTSTGASGGLAAIELRDPPTECVFRVGVSTLATTQSISLQSAQESSGPWVIEASTQITTAASTAYVMRLTGPVGPWVRPYLHTTATGTYAVMFLGVE